MAAGENRNLLGQSVWLAAQLNISLRMDF